MDIEMLIERLEAWNEQHLSVVCGDGHFACDYLCENEDCIVVRAATALSTLQDENEKLRAELEQVKRERDAIEQDFRAFAKQWWEEDNGFPCWWCKFENSGECEWKAKQPDEEKICAGRAFEWRGPQKEE